MYVPAALVSGRQHLQMGDIVLAASSGSISVVGKSARLTRDWEGTFGAFCAIIRARPSMDPQFLALYLRSQEVRRRWSAAARGTNINNLKRGDLESTPVPFPALCEQRRIVNVLDDYLSRLNAAEHSLRTCVGKLEALSLSSLTAARAALDRYSSTPIRDVADTSLGKMLDAKRQSGEPTPYLRNINVRWGAFDLSDLQATPLTDDEVARFEVRPGDLMVCEGGEPGRCAVWRDAERKVAFQKALHRVRVRDARSVSPEFLALMLTEAIQSGRSERLFTGTTIKHLPQEKLRQIELPLPPLAVQDEVLARTDRLSDAAGLLRSELTATQRRAAALRESLLTAAFSGNLTGNASASAAEEVLSNV